MDVEVRTLVMGHKDGTHPVETATLPGYRRVTLRRRHYPAIVAAPSSSVEGCLTGELDRRAATILDAFETEEYDRIRRPVTLADGTTVEAWTFVASRRANPSATSWNLTAWQRNYKRELLRRLRASRTWVSSFLYASGT